MSWFNSLQSTPIITPQISTTASSFDTSDESLKESDDERHFPINIHNITFRKVYRKKSPKKPSLKITKNREYSQESGVTPFTDLKNLETTSDYVTCTSGTSPDILERNVFDFSGFLTNDESNKSQISVITKSEGVGSSDLSFVSVSEIYKYVDEAEGIVLYERRLLKTPIR